MYKRQLTVLPKDFGTVEVEPEPASTEAANAEFRNNIWPLYEQPVREKLWAGAFLCPAENYMTLVDFGQVKVIGGQQGSRSNSTKLYTIPGEPCRAPANGVVVLARNLALTGNTVVIDHGNGYETSYSHLLAVNVRRGQEVRRGDIIGLSGNTGLSIAPHLHYEVRHNGMRVDPIHYFFMELSPVEYQRIIRIAQSGMQSFD